jgi:hypothetical protein
VWSRNLKNEAAALACVGLLLQRKKTVLWSITDLNGTASHLRRPESSATPPLEPHIWENCP